MKTNLKISFGRLTKSFTIAACCCTVLTQHALGQFSDNFSDKDFSANPTWSGSASDFIINASDQLQLNNTIAGTSYLVVPFSFIALGESEWQFNIAQDFAPSGSNYTRVYLMSDQQDLSGSLNGYYLQFGENLTNDAIRLFRQTGSASPVLVCRAMEGKISNAFSVQVKVKRSVSGSWEIWADYSGGTNFVLEGSGTDNVHTVTSYFGIRCTYSVTNVKKFFFDNFAVSAIPAPDLTPPTVSSVTVVSQTELDILFSESLNATAEIDANYSIDAETTNPISSVLQADQRTVKLTFAQPFANGVQQTLFVKNVEDLATNLNSPIQVNFLFFQPEPAVSKDIILSEIFSDFSPPISLPEGEFIEIFNRSQKPFDLSGWKISDGNSTGTLASFILLPGEYIVLSGTSTQPLFSAYGKTMGVVSFPSLNNTGDVLVLKDPSAQTIDSVNYTDSWYKDDEKKDGGWSLELIDPMNVCSESENWISSEDEKGGTPGTQNSVYANKPDLTGPELNYVIPLTSTLIQLRFNEKLEKMTPDPHQFSVSPSVPVSKVSFADPSLTTLHVNLAQPLLGGVEYRLTAEDIFDCAGNKIIDNFGEVAFALPEEADSLDLVINEILFNPRSTGVDFVEVYNQSSKFINLKNWSLANQDANGIPLNNKTITETDFLVKPHQHLVFTEDGNILKGEYLQGVEGNFFRMDMPSLSDDESTIALVDSSSSVIDAFSYAAKMHSVFIKEDEGVSLERISIHTATNDAGNWKSASSTSGYATPGYGNSNSITPGISDEAIAIDPEVFLPIYGQPDFTHIRYQFEHGGYVANIKIVDPHGREIKQLASNAILGTEGSFRWDGDQDNGSKARMGSYMVWFEVFDENGTVKTFRKRVVVAGKL
jgi:hypothetical protein